MEILNEVWTQALVRPLYNLLIFFYQFGPAPNMGMALVCLTLFLRVLMLPLGIRADRSVRRYEESQSEIKAIEKKYQSDLQAKKQHLREFMEAKGISVYAGIWSLLLQGLFVLVLYDVFTHDLQPISSQLLYGFYTVAESSPIFDSTFFGIFDLLQTSVVVAGITALAVFAQQIFGVRQFSRMSITQRALIFMLPIFTFIGAMLVSASKPLYIGTSILFSFMLHWILSLSMSVRAASSRKRKKSS
jgi:YidC/Oxa1 family membrane protein insertase